MGADRTKKWPISAAGKNKRMNEWLGVEKLGSVIAK
jgi:hypothetical protein